MFNIFQKKNKRTINNRKTFKNDIWGRRVGRSPVNRIDDTGGVQGKQEPRT